MTITLLPMKWYVAVYLCFFVLSTQINIHAFLLRSTNNNKNEILMRYNNKMNTSCLFLAKSSSRNKQADLRQKLEEAKRQNNNQQQSDSDNNASVTNNNVDDSSKENDIIKMRNDRLRFEELLKKSSGNVLNDFSSDGYLTKQQEEEEINASVSGIDRIFEGDPAPIDCFEELVSIKSSNAIGVTGKKNLVPWLHKNPLRHHDYIVIITEPRLKSNELYETIQTIQLHLSNDIKNKIIIINADSPSENRRYLKKYKYDDEKVIIYSDEKREFMRSYTATYTGDNRWGMSMFILYNGRVEKIARDIDQYGACKTIQNAIKSLT